LALEQAGIKVDSYYASEIDPYAIKVSKSHFPDIIQLGDISNVSYADGVLKSDMGIFEVPKIDMIIGGSPCQDFTNIGSREGIRGVKSILMFQYFRLMDEIKPSWFLLENVNLKKNDVQIVNGVIKCEPIGINSSIFCAQLRNRQYWTNIPVLPLPAPCNETMYDVVEEKQIDPATSYMDSSEKFTDFMKRSGITSLKSDTGTPVDVLCETNKSRANRYRLEHVRGLDQKARCLTTQCGNIASTSGSAVYVNGHLRRLSPEEAEKLQTLPERFTDVIPMTYRYKVIGDGWTIAVISHIFKGLTVPKNQDRFPIEAGSLEDMSPWLSNTLAQIPKSYRVEFLKAIAGI